MFAVIRRYSTVEGSTGQILKRVNEGFAPLIRQRPGFVAYYVLDAGGGTIASVSVFETRDAAEDSTKLASDWVRRNIPSLIRTSPVILTGEVATHAVREEVRAPVHATLPATGPSRRGTAPSV